ncbi:Hypothetical predicted protein [Paramuricea clavata]|uniref:Uncharacterized protein n=1 Tax=Paramuricea clavata TaxID=317549 RepID=A0A6S7GZT3_PARCT|nr:Hypothetical predicted protein [Paramuricea clavata]
MATTTSVSCTCTLCTKWLAPDPGTGRVVITCAENRCLCEKEVNLEGEQVGGEWRVYYRCARRGCGYNLNALAVNLKQQKTILRHCEDYLLDQHVRCDCNKIAGYSIEDVPLLGLQLFFVCRLGRCQMHQSTLEVDALSLRGVRCLCHKPCVLRDGFYICPNADDTYCGFWIAQQDSITHMHVELTCEQMLEHAYLAFPYIAQRVCDKPGRLKFKYNANYTNGHLGYVCGDQDCDVFITDILHFYK